MSTKIGLQGELLASSVLLSYGIENDLVSKDKYDIVAWFDQKPMRVQVKATAKCYNENDGKSLRYNFQTAYGSDKRPYNDNEVDFLILVALDIRIAQFILPINNKTKKIYEKQMTIENERNTFNIIKNTLFNKCLCS
mgnify:FL=1|jgi:hypothetical protein|tara:strand:- start:597 stop:1007 length:411 start_codon:yes stop_codon:yes gene_type:complete